jgi:hypothetical protein
VACKTQEGAILVNTQDMDTKHINEGAISVNTQDMDTKIINYTLILYGYDNERQKWERVSD